MILCLTSSHERLGCTREKRPTPQALRTPPMRCHADCDALPRPVSHDLTIVITTSPIPSIPSTALLEALLKSFEHVNDLHGCKVIIVCDGIGIVLSTDAKPNWKCSKVNPKHVTAYKEYTSNVERLAACLQRPSEALVLHDRHGCGLAVKAALDRVQTPFVMVVQHDQLFLRNVNVGGVLAAMHAHPAVLRYVGIQSRTTLRYKERVADRFGIALDEFIAHPHLSSPLLPLLMYYDKPHIVWTEHLRERVYANGAVKPGDFVEDVLGRAQMEDIKANGIRAHGKYGTWVLCDDEDSPATYHLSGRKVVGDTGGSRCEKTAIIAESLLHTEATTMWSPTNRVSIHATVPGLAAAASSGPVIPDDAQTASSRDEMPSAAGRGKFKGVCYRCQAKGHSFRFCPLASLEEDRHSDEDPSEEVLASALCDASLSEPSSTPLSPVAALDHEGMSCVFAFLQPAELATCAATCSQWATHIRHDGLVWRNLFARDFKGRVEAPEARRTYRRAHMAMRALLLRPLTCKAGDKALTPRASCAAGMIGSHVVMMGGATRGFYFTSSLDVWCPATERVLASAVEPDIDPQLLALHRTRWQHSAVTWDEKLWVYGGMSDVWAVNTISSALQILHFPAKDAVPHGREPWGEAPRVASWLVLLTRHEEDTAVPGIGMPSQNFLAPALQGHTACAVEGGRIHVGGVASDAEMPFMLFFGGKGAEQRPTSLLWCIELREVPRQGLAGGVATRQQIVARDAIREISSGEQLPTSLRWRLLEAAGTAPAARYCHSAVLTRRGWMQFSGWAERALEELEESGVSPLNYGTRFLNDLHLLELTTMTWTALTTSGTAPRGRCQAVMATSSDEEICMVFGGACHSDPEPGQRYGDMVIDLCDTALLHLPTLSWLPSDGLPTHPKQGGGTNALIRTADSRCFIFGGMQSDPGSEMPCFLNAMTEVVGLDSGMVGA